MKIARKLPFVLVAAGILVLLSSCNEMLDGIFPQRQIVNVTVEVYAPAHPDYASGYSYAKVQVLDNSGTVLSTLSSFSWTYDASTSYLIYSFQFTKLRNETYGLASLYYGSLLSAYYPSSSGTPSFYVENSAFPTTLVTLPYNQSSDITNLTVFIN